MPMITTATGLHLSRRHPLTGETSRSRHAEPLVYADLDGVVFTISAPRNPGKSRTAVIATEHLTEIGRRQWLRDTDDRPPTWSGPTVDSVVGRLLLFCDSAAFPAVRYRWQRLEIDPAKVPEPLRVVRVDAHHYQAVANDPRPYSGLDTDGTPEAHHVVAEARSQSGYRSGRDLDNGWTIRAGLDEVGPVRKHADMLAQLKEIARERLA